MNAVWPQAMPHHLDYPKVGIDAILEGSARAFPDRVALRDGDLTLTYAELRDAALRVANGLRTRGIRPGDAVALHLPNSAWYIVAYYGILCSGAAVAPLNPAQPAAVLRHQLTDSNVKAVFTHPRTWGVFAGNTAPESVEFFVRIPGTAVAPEPTEQPAAAPPFPQKPVTLDELLTAPPLVGHAVDPESVAHLQLTGGTTGHAKAVRVLHRNLVASTLQVGCWKAAALPELDESGTVRLRSVPAAQTRYTLVPGQGATLAIAPLFHSLGLVGYNVHVLLGTTVILSGRFDPEWMLDAIGRFGINSVAGSPTMFHALLRSPGMARADLSSVRLLSSGAGPIDPESQQRLRTAFSNALIADAYGLSEATALVTTFPLGDNAALIPKGSIGVPTFDTEIEIRGDDGTVLPRGETGEIWVRGPQVADGYHGRPDLTAEQFVHGWLRTGDLGVLDEQGCVSLVGRAKDMLVFKGYNVYPRPLEDLLCSHPAIAQCAVVGKSDPAAGQIPVAFVVLRASHRDEELRGQAFLDEVMAYVAEQVAPYQKIRQLFVVESLPVTPTGKFSRPRYATFSRRSVPDRGFIPRTHP